MSINLTHKQGATFEYAGVVSDSTYTPISLTGYTITAQFRDEYGTLEGTATITLADQGTDPGEFTLSVAAADTVGWPAKQNILFDLRVASPGARVDYSETIVVRVVARQTTS